MFETGDSFLVWVMPDSLLVLMTSLKTCQLPLFGFESGVDAEACEAPVAVAGMREVDVFSLRACDCQRTATKAGAGAEIRTYGRRRKRILLVPFLVGVRRSVRRGRRVLGGEVLLLYLLGVLLVGDGVLERNNAVVQVV